MVIYLFFKVVDNQAYIGQGTSYTDRFNISTMSDVNLHINTEGTSI